MARASSPWSMGKMPMPLPYSSLQFVWAGTAGSASDQAIAPPGPSPRAYKAGGNDDEPASGVEWIGHNTTAVK